MNFELLNHLERATTGIVFDVDNIPSYQCNKAYKDVCRQLDEGKRSYLYLHDTEYREHIDTIFDQQLEAHVTNLLSVRDDPLFQQDIVELLVAYPQFSDLFEG